MKTLYICKSAPDKTTHQFMDVISPEKSDSKMVSLFEDGTNWDDLVDDIFSYDRVISWW